MSHNPPPLRPCVDLELERQVCGLSMLCYPLPDWLSSDHFFSAPHARVFAASKQVGGNPAKVAALLREQGRLYHQPTHGGQDWHSKPWLINHADLAKMCVEADFAMRMGWLVEPERLRELTEARVLLERLERLCVRLRVGDVTADEAKAELKEAM